jgi:N-acetylglucosamine kinase-like BadF-type ATPase
MSEGGRPALLAVDAGGSKVEAALLSRSGQVLGAARFTRSRRDLSGHGHDGEDPVLAAVASAVSSASKAAGRSIDRLPLAPLGVYCMAGVDFPQDQRRLVGQLRRRGWTAENVVRNDTDAILRAGSEEGWGVGVVCGYGINCTALAPDGRSFRFPAIGHLSGDWGGGSDIGPSALWFAVRAEDGRGPPTALAATVPAYFAMRRPSQVMQAIHFGRLDSARLAELPPLVFRAARGGDRVAQDIVDRQADEIVAMAGAAMRKLRLTRMAVPMVLGGGIFRATDADFHRRVEDGLRAVAPAVRVTPLRAPPVLGAALIGLERLGVGRRAQDRARAALTNERFATHAVCGRAARR